MSESKTNMPVKPFVGMTFRPISTDAVGIITEVSGRDVTYRFTHDGVPATAPRYTRAYSELRKMSYFLGRNVTGVRL